MSTTTISIPNAAQDIQSTHAFLDQFFPEPRHFDVRLWNGTHLGFARDPRFTIVLNSPGALRRMAHIPLELSLAEAFIRGEFDIEGDLVSAFQLFNAMGSQLSHINPVTLLRLWLALPNDRSQVQTMSRKTAHLFGLRHSRERDRAAIQYHYDVGNDFYELWLDKRMVYSCAYFPTGTEDLDTAQAHKLDIICRKLQLKPGERLLDIGCGWGGLVIYAAQKYGVQAMGVTLSKEQHSLANKRIAAAGLGHSAVKLTDYRDLQAEPFDKIVSVGMFEHVGRDHLPEYFGHAYNLLKPGGLFLNHGISAHPDNHQSSPWSNFIGRYVIGVGSFINRYIFPDTDLIPVSDVNLVAERTGFEVRHLENWREHYALTLRQWLRRLENHHTEAAQLTSEVIYRTWKLYMSLAVYGFETGVININQTVLQRPQNGHGRVKLADSRCCKV
jgi:cyclopropane-fatty-acyl-phospholipid synthase